MLWNGMKEWEILCKIILFLNSIMDKSDNKEAHKIEQ